MFYWIGHYSATDKIMYLFIKLIEYLESFQENNRKNYYINPIENKDVNEQYWLNSSIETNS